MLLRVLCCFLIASGLLISQAQGPVRKRKHLIDGVIYSKPVPPPQPINVILDSEPVTFTGAQPQTLEGRVMVPLRGVFEKIGCFVEYDAANHIITAHYRNESVEIRMGSRIANKNGAEILMEVPAVIVNGNALVPLRFLAEAIGAKVEWDEPTKTVSIKTGG